MISHHIGYLCFGAPVAAHTVAAPKFALAALVFGLVVLVVALAHLLQLLDVRLPLYWTRTHGCMFIIWAIRFIIGK